MCVYVRTFVTYRTCVRTHALSNVHMRVQERARAHYYKCYERLSKLLIIIAVDYVTAARARLIGDGVKTVYE